MGREDDHKPVAAGECFADFVVPLPGSNNVCATIPERNAMLLKYLRKPLHEAPVFSRVGEEDFARQKTLFAAHLCGSHGTRFKELIMRPSNRWH